MIFFS